MKRLFSFLVILVMVILTCRTTMAQLTFEPSEYQSRRQKLMEKIEDGFAVLLGAQEPKGCCPFYQTNDFLYLTGVEMPNCIVIVDGIKRESHLFFTISEKEARNYGIPLALVRNPIQVTGIENIHPLQEFEKILKSLVQENHMIYTLYKPEEGMRECSLEKLRAIKNNKEAFFWDNRKTKEEVFIDYLRELLPENNIQDCSEVIWNLRIIKSPAEIALLRKAGTIAVKAHREMIKATRVGMKEYELAALFRFYLKKEGAQNLAYQTIVCSGPNHPYLHYYKHDRILKDGDFLVIDAGPDFHYYDIDITVSYPANGKFTPRQKEIYTISKTMHEACMQVYRPKLSREQAKKEVHAILKEKGINLDDPMFEQRGMKYVFGHYVGMAVHDVGGMPDTLRAGMVLANEPFAVFPEENLGVRVEDTILITETGCENLTPGLPRTIEEIEELMKEPGVVQVLKEKDLY
ncbi:MAG: Xaa-Pro peptidase family protein [bacterium]